MNKTILLSLFAVSVGCKDKTPSDKPSAAKEPATGKVAAADPKPSEPAPAVTRDFFTGTTVTLPTPAAKLRIGMSEAEAKAAAPEFATGSYEIPGTTVKYRSAKVHTQFGDGGLWNIYIDVLEPPATVKDWLIQKWGQPVIKKDSLGRDEVYWNGTSGLRAKLRDRAGESTLYFSAIIPRDALLGSDAKAFAFDNPPLIGSATADAKKVLPALQALGGPKAGTDPSKTIISFLPSDVEYDTNSSIHLTSKDGKVVGYTLHFAGDAAALGTRLESIYGPGKPIMNNMYTTYKGPYPVKAELRTDGMGSVLWVGNTK